MPRLSTTLVMRLLKSGGYFFMLTIRKIFKFYPVFIRKDILKNSVSNFYLLKSKKRDVKKPILIEKS